MKTEDELLGLLAKTYELDCIGYVKDYVAENVIYITPRSKSPFIIGKEKVIATIQHWFLYHENFRVYTEAIVRPATQKRMRFISLVFDYDERCRQLIIIESED